MKKVKSALTVLTALLVSVNALAETEKPQTNQDQFSYAIGYQIGSQIAQQLKSEGLDVNPAFLAQALEDVIAGNEPALTIDEMNAAISSAQQQAQEQTMANAQLAVEAGETFRNQYAEQDGVMRTDSGMLYRILDEGSGEKPAASDTVVVHYRGTLINGAEFDSSIKRNQPATFGLNSIIPGWQEILQLMPEGSRWEVVIPPALAYGSTGAGGMIGPEETLIFEIELIEIK
ncbi:FKBP-type peptidyl-prolyl cis-trans isomerase [Gammaproteobacteria bacterium]|jgi:FKBP-type peptidyl-prolyl cis-trans isomerase FklB|nr:FKBP-type peptidyl-prolyl cis-trans isomerase [Gammaproteobacteria bacterium]MDC1097022.1 FKBP-type peptidyl-prolyl cis-trans isomerase [Gammaproteobacteria bacterium]